MKPLTRISALALLLTVTGCATLRPVIPPDLDASLRLADGLAALEAARYRDAFDDLAWVLARCEGRENGHLAGIAIAALELDPRNPEGRPAVGAAMLAGIIARPGPDPTITPLAEAAYLMALALGAPPAPHTAGHAADDDGAPPATVRAAVAPVAPAPPTPAAPAPAVEQPVHRCGPLVVADAAAPRPIPTLPGPSMAAMLARSEAERGALAERTGSLEAELEAVRARLEATRSELDRIRRTLRP